MAQGGGMGLHTHSISHILRLNFQSFLYNSCSCFVTSFFFFFFLLYLSLQCCWAWMTTTISLIPSISPWKWLPREMMLKFWYAKVFVLFFYDRMTKKYQCRKFGDPPTYTNTFSIFLMLVYGWVVDRVFLISMAIYFALEPFCTCLSVYTLQVCQV